MRSWRKPVVGKIALARIVLPLALGVAAAPAVSQERDGFYFGIDLGAFFPRDVSTDGNDTDVRETRCDGFLFPANSADPACAAVGVSWTNRFNMDTGALGGLTVGYMMDSFRFEFEYLYRTGGGETAPLGIVENRGAGEFVVADEKFDDFEAHHLLANVYYDFLNGSKFTPYLGFGIGWARNQVDYEGIFVRNSPEVFRNDPDLRAIEAAAGTVTRGREKFSDGGFGYQILVGVDYWLADHLSLGMKLRYAEFDEISDGRHEWELLRGHESAVGPGGDRVSYEIDSDDLRFWGMSLNLKYEF